MLQPTYCHDYVLAIAMHTMYSYATPNLDGREDINSKVQKSEFVFIHRIFSYTSESNTTRHVCLITTSTGVIGWVFSSYVHDIFKIM